MILDSLFILDELICRQMQIRNHPEIFGNLFLCKSELYPAFFGNALTSSFVYSLLYDHLHRTQCITLYSTRLI